MAEANNTVSFMTPVAAAGVELMSSNANYQNKLRTFESALAQEQTHAQSLAITNQANAIVKSGQKQADTYYAQAGQSVGSAVMDGGQSLGSFAGDATWKEDSAGRIVENDSWASLPARGICKVFGGSGDAKLQRETQQLSRQVDEHTALLREVDDTIANRSPLGDGGTVGEGSEQGSKKPQQSASRSSQQLSTAAAATAAAGGGAGANASKSETTSSASEESSSENAPQPLNSAQLKAKRHLESKYSFSQGVKGSTQDEEAVLNWMGANPAKDSRGNPIPGKTELDMYRERLQNKIDDKEKMISGKQSQIQNIRQQRTMRAQTLKDMTNGISNALQAGYTKDKAQADAYNTEWGFVKEMGSNVFGAAAQAMTDCNNQTDKMIDGITGALRHVVGG